MGLHKLEGQKGEEDLAQQPTGIQMRVPIFHGDGDTQVTRLLESFSLRSPIGSYRNLLQLRTSSGLQE